MAKKTQDLVNNRRARHDYELLDKLEAGIVLQGTEIKSLRNNGGSLQEAYVKIFDGEVWLVGCHIAPYAFGNVHNHDPDRDRKLLVKHHEIRKLRASVKEKGLTIVPVRLYLRHGRAKVEIAVGRGKKMHDKRHAIKQKEEKLKMAQARKRDFD